MQEIEIPARIDRYRIVRPLGRGAMGDVYLADDPKLDRRLALKVMSTPRIAMGSSDLEELLQRFVQEARAAARLTHPGIVTVYDADTDAQTGKPFIAMEFVSGTSLHSRLRSGQPLSVSTSLGLIVQVARALDYAHREGVVHRDVKPANLLLDADCTQVKIADFGIAKLMSNSMTTAGQVLGSPNYMAPEQIKAEHVDGRTDLFGLGAVLYECLTGRPPFASDSFAATSFKILSVDPRPVQIYNSDIPASLGELVNKTLEKNPQDRFQTGEAMAEALDEVSSEITGPQNYLVTRELRPVATDPSPEQNMRDSLPIHGRSATWRALAASLLAIATFFIFVRWAMEPRSETVTNPVEELRRQAASESAPPAASAVTVDLEAESFAGSSSPKRAPQVTTPNDPAAARTSIRELSHLTAPGEADATMAVVVHSRIRRSMISIWVNGEKTMTRQMQAPGMFKRWAGKDYYFEVPVPAGDHEIEVHVSSLSSKMEVHSSINGALSPGETAVLNVDVNNIRKKLRLSWRHQS